MDDSRRLLHFALGSRIFQFLSLSRSSSARCTPIVQFKLSDIGEGIAEVHVKEW
jgi:hypothetical protein